MPCLPGKLHNFYLSYRAENREYDLRVQQEKLLLRLHFYRC